MAMQWVAARCCGAAALARGVACTSIRSSSSTSSSSTSAWLRALHTAAACPDLISLSNIADNPGALKARRRVGRGEGSGRGGQCGRGHKGQKARSGASRKVRQGFEGGQTPLSRRLPKRGFKSKKPDYTPVNVSKLQQWIDAGRLDVSQPITTKTLVDSGVLHRVKHGVKLLGSGIDSFTAKIDIAVSDASKTAQYAVERNGGELRFVYYNRLGLRAHLQPHKFDVLPKLARPPRKWALKHGVDEHL